MRTLIYKRTHSGDPDPGTGVFGNRDCMGEVRAWNFDAVIGIGGVGDEPRRHGIAGKLTWIGIGPQKFFDNPESRGPQLVFRHFKYFGEDGPLLAKKYPALARHMYETHRRLSIHLSPSAARPTLDRDVQSILRLARSSPPSGGPAERELRKVTNKCTTRPVRRAPVRC
jgi:hypothetical protein